MAPDIQEESLEARTFDYGREIFARLGRDTSFPLSPRWWDERLMDVTMGSEALKVQLFRFIDVLPMLHTSEEINRHLREYFAELGSDSPPWLRLGLRLWGVKAETP